MHMQYEYLVTYQSKYIHGNIRITRKKGIKSLSGIEEIREKIKNQILETEKNLDIGNIIITNIFLLNRRFKWK